MTTTVVNFNNIIPQCEFLDPLTLKPSRPWLIWLQNPSLATLNLTNPLGTQSGGTGTGVAPSNGQILVGNGTLGSYNVTNLDVGDGIATTIGTGTISIENTGVLSNIAGAGIGVNAATGDVTISNTGVLSIIAGDGIEVDQATGDVTISATGVSDQENQTATSGQTVFILTTMTYVPGSNMLSVFIDGVNQQLGVAFNETNSTTVTFTAGLHVGAKVRFAVA